MKDEKKFKDSATALLQTVEKLRAPEGCPWDREQTHHSLRRCLMEECAELLDAIDNNDHENMREELGDVLLNVYMQCVIADENNSFDIVDVMEELNDKLIRRHPHVFSDAYADHPDKVIALWQEVKKTENKPKPKSVLDKVPVSLSSLLTARELQRKGAEYGFDWDKPEQIIEKIEEELAELKQALKEGNDDEVDDEIGDLLFSVVNLSRFRKRETAEELLRRTNMKFKERFQYIEKELSAQGKSLEEATLEEMDLLWNQAKKTK